MKPPRNHARKPASLLAVATEGGWWCSSCRAYASPTEASLGEPRQQCDICGAYGTLAWNAPTIKRQEAQAANVNPNGN